MIEQSFTIDDIGPSLNTWYAGCHWTKRKKIADIWHTKIKNIASKLIPIKSPVELSMHFQFGKSRLVYDASNCSAAFKLIEDGLVKAGIILSDDHRTIKKINISVEKTKESKSYTIVSMKETKCQ